jgi:hypothetical protein
VCGAFGSVVTHPPMRSASAICVIVVSDNCRTSRAAAIENRRPSIMIALRPMNRNRASIARHVMPADQHELDRADEQMAALPGLGRRQLDLGRDAADNNDAQEAVKCVYELAQQREDEILESWQIRDPRTLTPPLTWAATTFWDRPRPT